MSKGSRGTPSFDSGQELHLHQRYARILGAVLPGAADQRGFRRVTEQLLDHGGDGFAMRVVQEEFAAARAAAAREGIPLPIPEQFLARLDLSSPLYWVANAMLGSASLTLLRTTDLAEFEKAIIQHYADFRHYAPPYDGGVSYGSYRYLDGTHVDLRDTQLVVLPANAPRFDQATGQWLYPDYNTHGRPRMNRSVAAVQASRMKSSEIPLNKKGKELFEALGIKHSLETFDNYLDPELRQSLLQVAFTLSTGYSPIYRSAIKVPGRQFPGLRFSIARNAQQASWELAARLGSHILDPATDLNAVWKSLRSRGGDTRPTKFIPHDLFSQLSRNELFEVALKLPGAPEVRLNTFEWEHHRSQRFTKRILGIVKAMGLDPVWASRFQMLTGLCEPENLHFLPPWMHAREDLYAAGFWVSGEFKTEAFRANRARMDRYENIMVAAPDALPDVDFVPTTDKHWSPRRFPNAELERVKDVLVAYEPRHVIALISEMNHPDVQRAARKLRGSARRTWTALADQLNLAADVYGISPSLRLPK